MPPLSREACYVVALCGHTGGNGNLLYFLFPLKKLSRRGECCSLHKQSHLMLTKPLQLINHLSSKPATPAYDLVFTKKKSYTYKLTQTQLSINKLSHLHWWI